MAKKKPDPTDVIVGGNVRRRRLAKNMSQEKLGDALGLTFQQVQKYEKGTNRMGSSRLLQIAKILGVTVQDLFAGTPLGDPKASDPTNDPIFELGSSGRGVRLARSFNKLESGVQNAIVRMVETLAGDDDGEEETFTLKTGRKRRALEPA